MKKKDLQYLLEQGLFSEIDLHFANLMSELSGQEVAEVHLAAALVSRATGEGHVCPDLSSAAGKTLDGIGVRPTQLTSLVRSSYKNLAKK